MLKRNTMDMTHGTIWKELVIFSLPLLAGNLFQQLYNTTDSIIVGNFVGAHSLGAVTSVSPAINTLIGFFTGLSTGASVVISQYFGAKDEKNLSAAIHTALSMTFLLSIVFMVVGISAAPTLLHFMQTPPEVLPDATIYLRIYFAGVLTLMVYNMGSGILRAVGDARRPLYFLIFSSILNIVLDIIFVVSFDMGVAGVAIATVLSQGISDVLILALLLRTKEVYRIHITKLCLDKHILRRIFDIGFPAGLQMAIIAFSNVFVQSYINAFGASSTSGWGVYNRIDSLVNLPMQSMGLAMTTFVGQNAGAGRVDRIKRGIKSSLALSIAITQSLSLVLVIFAPQIISLFNRDNGVLTYGTLFIRYLTPFTFLCCMNQIHASVLRGMGNAKIPAIIMIFSFVIFRQIYLFVISTFTNSILPVAFGYPAGWLVCSILMDIYFKRSNWQNHLKAA